MALILEVLDSRTGEVRARVRLGDAPVTIGRAFDNDVVLDDPYADARHARIATDEAGAPVLEDLGSVNGLATAGASRMTRVPIQPDLEVRVGRTRLRFRDAAIPLPAALPDLPPSPARDRLRRWGSRWWGQLAVVTIATVVVGWITWLETFTASPATQVVSTALGILLLATIWAGIWAVASRIVVQRFRFLGHLAVVSAVFFAAYLLVVVNEWAGFVFPDNGLVDPLVGVLALLLIAGLVAGHLALASPLSRRRRWMAGVLASAGLLAIGLVFTAVEEDVFSDIPAYSATLKPFPARWLPTATVKEFERVEEDLQRAVDALAEKD